MTIETPRDKCRNAGFFRLLLIEEIETFSTNCLHILSDDIDQYPIPIKTKNHIAWRPLH